MVDFKPSQVNLNGSFPPLVATMGRVEREAAAAIIVRTCQANGDTWAAVDVRDFAKVLGADLDAKVEPWVSLSKSPFFRPDFFELVEKGFARWIAKDGGPVEFTDKGLEALRRWVVEPAKEASNG